MTIIKILKTCFSTPFFIFGLLGSCSIAFLILATINNDSQWATVAITILLVIITAYYAFSTDKILHVNEKTLDLLHIERSSAKVEQIAKEFLVPFISDVKRMKENLKNKRNIRIIYARDTEYEIVVYTIYNDKKFQNAVDYVISQLNLFYIDEGYNERFFHLHINSIMKKIEKYDTVQQEYKQFISSKVFILFNETIIPATEKMKKSKYDSEISVDLYTDLFEILMCKSLKILDKDSELKFKSDFLNDYLLFVDQIYKNDLNFQSFIEEKTRQENKIIDSLNLLLSELDALKTDWINTYHMPIKEEDW